MDMSKIPTGENPPFDINVIIEVPKGGEPIKYEIDKASGAMFVDRFLYTSMRYPCNYGFTPHTLCGDGDPIDVLVVSDYSVAPLAVLPCKPVGVLLMEDDGGVDEKIIAVAAPRLAPVRRHVENYTDIEEGRLARIKHFFEHYKDGEDGKWVKIEGWGDADKARQLITESIERAQNKEAA